MPIHRCALTILEGYLSDLVNNYSIFCFVTRWVLENTANMEVGKEENYRGIDMNFTGALTWNSSGDLINEYVPGQRRWSGEPTPYLDEAWDGLEECK